MASAGQDSRYIGPGGRIVEYWEGGDDDGQGVIFHPGTPGTRVLGWWAHDAAVATGVRLVAVNRPGYGASTMSPNTPSLRDVGQSTAALAAHLGLDEYAVAGSSGGGPFAVATAVADPGRVCALGVVGGIGPWRLLEPPSFLPEDRRILELLDAGDVEGAWDGFRRQVEDELEALATFDDAVELIFGDDEDSLVHDERYRAMWADNMRVVLDGSDGYVLDNLAWGGIWDMDPRYVVAPTLLWYGDGDERCSTAHGRWYADRIAGSRLIVVPSTGHFDVIDGHWPEVLARLLQIWRRG
jgi:pimeloyl-ACP methyl ester carboxylesterase